MIEIPRRKHYFQDKLKKIKTFERKGSNHSIKETYKIIKGKDENGIKTVNEYKITEKIGQGTFAKVKLAIKCSTEEQFAVKIFKKSFLKRKKELIKENGSVKFQNAFQNVLKEIAVMKKLDHPNVIKLHEVIDDPEEDSLFLIMDYAKERQMIEYDCKNSRFYYLNDELGDDFLPESKLREIFREVLKGIFYLHVNDIIHRDIKPQNILFDEQKAKIADFGLSVILEEEEDKFKNYAGTYYFSPPEMISLEKKKEGYSGKSADIWSLGVTFFCFTFMQVPFDGNDTFEILENIEKQELEFPKTREISPQLKNFLQKFLKKYPNERITFEEILQDDWINKDSEELKKEIDIIQVNVSDTEIRNALIPIHTIVFIMQGLKRWRTRSNSSNSSYFSEGDSPMSLNDKNQSGCIGLSKFSTNKNNKKSPEKSNSSKKKKSPLIKRNSPLKENKKNEFQMDSSNNTLKITTCSNNLTQDY